MGYLVKSRIDGRYIVTEAVTVKSVEFAHVFESKKQALNFLNEHGRNIRDYEFLDQVKIEGKTDRETFLRAISEK